MKRSVLLVDDVQLYLDVEKEYLQYNPVDILTAQDGLQALDITRKQKPDIIFMDLNMPNMGGAECCRRIKFDPALLYIPIVMITSKSVDDMKACFDAHCDHFLSKPLDRDKFLGAVRQFLPEIDRREVRKRVDIPSSVHLNGVEIPCRIFDMSKGGAFVTTTHFGIPKSVVKISFTIPDGTLIKCDGRISWLNRTPGNYPVGFGIQFALMATDAKIRLADYLDSDKQAYDTSRKAVSTDNLEFTGMRNFA